MDQPSILDYVKAKLTFWKKSDLHIADPEEAISLTEVAEESPVRSDVAIVQEDSSVVVEKARTDSRTWLSGFPWLALSPLLVALIAQLFLEPPARSQVPAGVFYAFSFVLVLVAFWKKELFLIEPKPEVQAEERKPEDLQAVWMVSIGGIALALLFAVVKTRVEDDPIFLDMARAIVAVAIGISGFWIAWLWGKQSPIESTEGTLQKPRYRTVIVALVLILASIMALGGNQFNPINVSLWVASMVVSGGLLFRYDVKPVFSDLWKRVTQPVTLKFSSYFVLLLLAIGVILCFRFYNLSGLPGDMFSDHAEKLYDVNDLMNGQFKIFFERNTGREMFQFYWTALMGIVFGTGISFMSLKIGTALAGLITLYYIYRLGDELGGKWVALYALLFAGIAYWPNIISRIGLRFPLYPFCVAPVLFYLFRGLRRQNRNDFVWGGIWLGIGLHGYTASRIVPLLVGAAFLIYFLHKRPRGGSRRELLTWFLMFAFTSLLIFLPLYRYALDTPEMFAYRSLTRLGTTERELPGSPLAIFVSNTWNALIMFFWNNGDVWVHSIPGRPALAVIDAALFFCGAALVLARYVKRLQWRELFLLVSIPILLLPSILSLAFPNENPSLNRTAGAYVPVFVIVALGLDALVGAARRKIGGRTGGTAASVLAGALILASLSANSDLFFNQYYTEYKASAWNTSEMGDVMRGFSKVVGTPDTTWVVGYPYWVDTRLVGITAGFVDRNPEMSTPLLDQTTADPRAKLFILNPADVPSLDSLRALYPQGRYWLHQTEIPGKEFIIFMAPAAADQMP
jgi:hypothetical protein